MPQIDASEQQILESLDQLSPAARLEAIRRLVAHAAQLDRFIEENRPRILAVARERGLDWDALTESERESLIDQILHEP